MITVIIMGVVINISTIQNMKEDIQDGKYFEKVFVLE